MAFVPAVNTAEVVLGQAMTGQMVNNVGYFEFPGALTTSILTDLAVEVIAQWIAHLAINLSQELDLNTVKATDQTTAFSPSVIESAPPGTDGEVTGACNVNNVAIVLSERTPLRGRSFRGRLYQAGIPVSVNQNTGSITVAYQTDLLADYVLFFDDIETALSCEHVVVSRISGGSPRVTAQMTPITSYSMNVDYDSQRKRLIGRGA